VSFNTTVRQMTKMFQWPKCLSRKWSKCLSQRKARVELLYPCPWCYESSLDPYLSTTSLLTLSALNSLSVSIGLYRAETGPCTNRDLGSIGYWL